MSTSSVTLQWVWKPSKYETLHAGEHSLLTSASWRRASGINWNTSDTSMKPKPPKHLAYCQLKYSACNLIFILLLFMYLKMRQTVQLHHSAGDQSQLRYLTRTPLGWRTGSLWAASSCQSTYRQLLLSDGDSIQKKCGVIGVWGILARAVVGQSTSRPVVTTVTPFPVLVNS